jgi:hypothetical protein
MLNNSRSFEAALFIWWYAYRSWYTKSHLEVCRYFRIIMLFVIHFKDVNKSYRIVLNVFKRTEKYLCIIFKVKLEKYKLDVINIFSTWWCA